MLKACRIGRMANDGHTWLIRDVSLTLATGERLGLVGPSGSGKTLLLRSLALLDPLDAGQLWWHDLPVRCNAIPHYRSRVVYLHQRPALIEGTVEENLRYPFQFAIHRRRKFDRGQAERWLDKLGRDGSFLHRQSRDLSGGEMQITALLRAIQLEPETMLLDEPTAALDASATEGVERLVQQWHRERSGERSLVIVSHDRDQVQRIVDRVVALESGHLQVA